MFLRYGVPLIIAGVFACLLLGWGVAFLYDRKARAQDERERESDQ